MRNKGSACILPAVMIGSALLWYYSDKMMAKKSFFQSEPMIIVPKSMEKKAKAMLKEVKKAWENMM